LTAGVKFHRLPAMSHRFNHDLLRLIPPNARVILEVGCGAGTLAEAYRWVNPDVWYLGIEKVAEAARVAGSTGRPTAWSAAMPRRSSRVPSARPTWGPKPGRPWTAWSSAMCSSTWSTPGACWRGCRSGSVTLASLVAENLSPKTVDG